MTRAWMKRIAGGAIAFAVLAAGSGCVSLLPEIETRTLYRLDSPVLALDASGAVDARTVIVSRIDAPRGLAHDRIALRRSGAVAYMAGAAWLTPAPQLLHAAVVDAFHATEPRISPVRVEDGVDARYRLDLSLRHFEAVYDQGDSAAPLVQVTLLARLIDRETRSLGAVRTISASRRASTNRQGSIIDAFSAAANAAAEELAVWTAAQTTGG